MNWTQFLPLLVASERAINFAVSLKALNLFPSVKTKQIGLAKLTPVIYYGQAGGAGEYHAPNDPDNPASHIIDVTLPTTAEIIAAWYTPLHNIFGVLGFAFIDVEKHNAQQVFLKVGAYKGAQTRARIAIQVLYSE